MGTAPAEDYLPIAHSWDFERYSVVADLGGGGDALIAAVLLAYPETSGILMDRPDSILEATPRIGEEGLAERCRLIGADLLDSVPPGVDVYMLKHVLHGCEDERAIQILNNCRAALPESGRLLIIEFVIPDVIDRPDSQLEVRLMSDMLAVTGDKERSEKEWKDLLDWVGLEFRGIIPVDVVSIIEAARGSNTFSKDESVERKAVGGPMQ
jgi:O-methyltransferase domain